MEAITLHIKNMVCGRCIKVVKDELEKLNLLIDDIKLGEVKVSSKAKIDLPKVKEVLENSGFELLEDKKFQMVDKIKSLVIELIHHPENKKLNVNYSDYLVEHIGRDYQYLSTLFSTLENVTIEKYIILQKTERIKELLVYDELNMSEIAHQMGYSSPAHLSSQFKQVTGFSPTEFKKLKSHNRNALDKLGDQ